VTELAPELATKRLVLRPVDRQDITCIATLANDVRIAETTRSLPNPLTADLVTHWFESLAARREQAFAVMLKDESLLVGVVALTLAIDGKTAEIGYWLGHDYWGHGYMTEAVRRIARYAFGDLKLTAIDAGVIPGNEGSVGVLVKAGFDVEGRGTRPAPARGGDRDVLLFKATRASFARAALSQAVGRE
jgi:ribosomal-protein-alanine N-acetyltransferase